MSNSTFNAVAMRYSNKEGQVKFDDFVACYTKLKIMFGKLVSVSCTCLSKDQMGIDNHPQMFFISDCNLLYVPLITAMEI